MDDRISTAPIIADPAVSEIDPADRRAPSILRVQTADDIALAADLGFSFLLLADPALQPEARATGLGVLLEISLPHPGKNLEEDHPDWFVHGEDGPSLRFLSEYDATVDWWDAELAAYSSLGAAGFYIRNVPAVAPTIWTRLLEAAAARAPDTIFIAEIFGATPAQLTAIEDIGFSFCTASSCFWDFRSSWLNDDAARGEKIAPAVALAAPLGATAPSEHAVCRALRFSATYAAAWLLDATFCFRAGFELADEIRTLNALRLEHAALRSAHSAVLRSSPGAAIAVLERGPAFFITINASLDIPTTQRAARIMPGLGVSRLQAIGDAEFPITPAGDIALDSAAVKFFQAAAAAPVFWPLAPLLDGDAPRLAIEAITPQVDDGKFPVRRPLGDMVDIEADLICDGHDQLAGEVLVRAADETNYRSFPLTLITNDRWGASIPLERLGRHFFAVTAWKDIYGTFVDELSKKHAAGVPTSLELREGLALVEAAAKHYEKLGIVLERLREATEETLRAALLSDKMVEVMRQHAPRKFLTRSHDIAIDAERKAAAFASWYEVFPRSMSGDPDRHGNFRDVVAQLPRIADMGFDVLYFPPIHPIGKKNRKGKNNSLTPGPTDPGSPYAIGNEAGGHDAIHPELGTFADFKFLIDSAKEFGIELALDFAIQCAPDHPWLKEHKDWFDWRPDGSIRYAENPPKKYEDIVNVEFYAPGAQPGLWLALRDVVQFWVDQGIKIFRVDNPHTKPFPFWEWMISDILSRHPDVLFLAEAFTHPKIMYRLAKVGFQQSYTYFTWRNTKIELQEYLTELTTTAPKDFFKPNFFVNTPDINPLFLHDGSRGAFLIRAALAATLSGLWGVYNGFELCEGTPLRPGREEYLDSEKYQIRVWDYDRPGNIVAEIAQLNRIRKANAALHSHLGIEFLPCDNDQVVYFRKFAPDGNFLLIAISLDPQNIQDTTIELPLWRFGIGDYGSLAAEDLMRGTTFVWHGKYQPVRLNPSEQPFCIWRVAPVAG
jgi:starch synthase (maltosyl-transferring)